ncbi:MAG: ABC transporter permease [Defluviitaleaceae bacterium]|nr:ABC transporter permease [Defluviitaleaceae bacterium]
MWKYVIKRLIALIPVVAGCTFIVFMIMHLSPGDPATFALGQDATPEAIYEWREMHGLNDPILIQYANYIVGVFMGDFGTSFRNNVSITQEVMQRFPHTLQLSMAALSVSLLLAFPIGIISAVKQNTWIDGLSMFIALIGISMPVFWLGLLLVLFFSLQLGWFPSSGANQWNSVVLPGITLGTGMMAAMARTTRSSMLEVIRQDYIRTARSKGLSNGKVIRKHAIRNALIPVLTIFGIQLGNLLTGSVITETVFAWPGIGRLMIQGIAARDYPMVLGCMVMFVLCFAVINLLVDLAYAFVDPRIRAQYR